MLRTLRFLVAGALLATGLSACLSAPGNTSGIALVTSSTLNGWRYDYYRNSAYPCSVIGYQTFVVGTKVGSSDTAAAPLWTFMHGGGAGYFDA